MRRKENKKNPVEEVVTSIPLETVEEAELPVQCNVPAPLVINGGMYCGCQMVEGHEGSHEVRINWPRG